MFDGFTLRKIVYNLFGCCMILLICLSGCKRDPLEIGNNSLVSLENYLKEKNITANSAPEGYFYKADSTNDSGTAISTGDIVSIYYHVEDLDGGTIDALQPGEGDPVLLQHGAGAVFPVGIDLGLSQMKTGETFTFYLPASLAYGTINSSVTSGPVIVQIKVVSKTTTVAQKTSEINEIEQYITSEHLSGVISFASGLNSKELQKGNGNKPQSGTEVTFTYTGKLINNTTFDQGTETITLNNNELITGLQEGIGRMRHNERALLIMPSALGYGASVRVIPHYLRETLVEQKVIPEYAAVVSPFSTLLFEVTLQ